MCFTSTVFYLSQVFDVASSNNYLAPLIIEFVEKRLNLTLGENCPNISESNIRFILFISAGPMKDEMKSFFDKLAHRISFRTKNNLSKY